MLTPRLHVALPLGADCVGSEFALPDAAAHHAVRVLRLVRGDALALFDGQGGEYAATIKAVDKRGATVRIDRFDPIERESPLELTLAQAIIASDMMDYAVRKATELGVTALQPIAMARSAPLPAGERAQKRLQHWQQVAIAACEQCGRNRVPPVGAVASVADWLAGWQGRGLIFAPGAARSLADLAPPAGALALLVGPEGGFAPEELKLAERAGWEAVCLGPRVLRAETTGAAVLAAMQVLWGDA